MIIRINKAVVYWLVVFVLEAAFIFCYMGDGKFSFPVRPTPAKTLVMTSSEANLTRNAINLVMTDMSKGILTSTDAVLAALQAELPTSVHDKVMRAVGHPDFLKLTVKLTQLSQNIQISE